MKRQELATPCVESVGNGIDAVSSRGIRRREVICVFAAGVLSVAFADDVVGGQNALIRSWIKSPDYQAGVKGWSINKDGTVEFNNGVFRGSITSGTSPGQHIIINNPVTGDAIDVYDANNNLVYNINSAGDAVSTLYNLVPAWTQSITTFGGELLIEGPNGQTEMNQNISFPVVGNTQTSFQIVSTSPSPQFNTNGIEIFCDSNDLTKRATVIVLSERGIGGSVVVTDQISTNNLQHAASMNLVFGAGGLWNSAHGCSFTPRMAVVTEVGPAGTIPLVLVVDNTAFTATNWSGHAFNGGAAFVGNVNVNVVFFG